MSIRFFLAVLWAGTAYAAEGSAISGEYLEDRSSRVFGCPCEFSSEYASGGREAVLAWKVETGEYQGEALRGLRLAAVLAGNSTLSAATTLRRSTVFVDAAAPAAQQRAGVAWLKSQYGDTLGRILGVHVVPIVLQVNPDTAVLRVGDFLDLRMRRANVAADTDSWASLLYDPLTRLTSATLGTTLVNQFTGPDLQMRWSRDEVAITGFYGTFLFKQPT